MGRQVKLRIWRGNKDQGDFQNINVESNEG